MGIKSRCISYTVRTFLPSIFQRHNNSHEYYLFGGGVQLNPPWLYDPDSVVELTLVAQYIVLKLRIWEIMHAVV